MTASRPLVPPNLPTESSGGVISVTRLHDEMVQTSVSYWEALRQGRRFPPRASMESCLSPQMRDHAILVEVLDRGMDYQYRQVGTAVRRAFTKDFSSKFVSKIIEESPKLGLGLRMLYEMVRASGEPLGYRGWAGSDMEYAAFLHHESAILPLGEDDVVDHILIVSKLVLRGGSTS